MKKILSFLILFILMASPSYGATWYAVAGTTPNFDAVSGTTISSVWCSVDDDEDCSGGSWMDWATQPATDDVFEASAIDGIVINVDPKGTSGATKVHLKNTAGGYYTLATNANITATISSTAGASDCVRLAGTTITTNPVTVGCATCTFTGSAGTAGADAIYSSHTAIEVIMIGAAQGALGSGINFVGSSGYVSFTGSCTGSDTANVAGCSASGAGYMSVAGSLIAGNRGSPYVGTIRWTPTAPSSGVNGHYFKSDGGGTEVYVGKNTETQAKANTDFYYFIGTSATSQAGTDSAGGGSGGAWGF